MLLFFKSLCLQAQCDTSTQVTFLLKINPDPFFNEVSWRITDITGENTYVSGTPANGSLQNFTYCLPKDKCLIFTILDQYGDGMEPSGSYSLHLNGVEIHNNPNGAYTFAESTIFNCQTGQYCNDPLPVDLGTGESTLFQSWYKFTPTDTGLYTIEACNTICPVKIWLYDNCGPNLVIDSSNLGTIAYANGGCASNAGAKLTMRLAANQTYYIRIGYTQAACSGVPLPFELSYQGPVVGCTDPNACNYEPLATVSDPSTCIYPGDPGCDNLPDLSVHQQTITTSLRISSELNTDACLIQEGCLRGYGNRNLIRFSTRIDNIGKQDYFIGATPANINQSNAQFVWDPCHGHWHYRGYAEYLLYDANGKRLPIGAKTGFCVLDLFCSPGGNPKYSCEYMGISKDCSDEYDHTLECQWIDITSLPAGQYQLVIKVNTYEEPDRTGRHEASYDNNYGTACFNLTYSLNGTPNLTVLPNCSNVAYDCDNKAFGPNVPDCEGNCNTGLLTGDYNRDMQRDATDLHLYLDQAINPTASTTACTDLNGDSKFSLYDAALVSQCSLHDTDSTYWGSRPICQFPVDVYNPFDRPNFRLHTLDTLQKFVDIQVTNPNRKQVGFDIEISGLDIDSVANLLPQFGPTYRIGTQMGRVIAIAATEAMIPKSTSYKSLLRVYYSSLKDTIICLKVNETVNENYERSNSYVQAPNCVVTGTSSSQELAILTDEVIAYPNPAAESITVLIPESMSRNAQVSLINSTGQIARSFPTAGQELFELERKDLPQGVYFLRISDELRQAFTKVVFH